MSWALIETNIRINVVRLVRSFQGKPSQHNDISWLNPVDAFVKIVEGLYKPNVKYLDSVRLRKLRKYCNEAAFPMRPNPKTIHYHDFLGSLEAEMLKSQWEAGGPVPKPYKLIYNAPCDFVILPEPKVKRSHPTGRGQQL